MLKKILISSLFLFSSVSSFALHISQEDIDGSGPHFILDDILAFILLGIIAIFVLGIILLCIFGTIWIGLERLLGIKRTTMFVNNTDVYLAHSSKHLKRFSKLKKRLDDNTISRTEKLEYDELLKNNYVFKARFNDEITVLCYYFNGVCQVNQKGWCARLYTYYAWLSPHREDTYPYDLY